MGDGDGGSERGGKRGNGWETQRGCEVEAVERAVEIGSRGGEGEEVRKC
jgi:hypothetical protein